MTFNNENLNFLRKQLEDTLKALGENNNIEFKIGRMSYTDGYCNIGLKAYSTEKVGAAHVTGVELEFLNSALKLGIPNDWLGKKVMLNDVEYTITGLNTRARKFPVILTRFDGASIKSTIMTIRTALNKA